jgi:hypothetical protein
LCLAKLLYGVILIVHLLLVIKITKMHGTCITIMDVSNLYSTHKSECRCNYYKLICQRFIDWADNAFLPVTILWLSVPV